MSSTTRSAIGGSNKGVSFATEVSQYDRISSGLIALLVLGLFVFATLFLIWCFGATEIGRGTPPPPPPHPDRIVPVTDEEINVVEFDGSDSQAFTQSLEMTGASVAELSEVKLSESDGAGFGIEGDSDGPGIGSERRPGPPGGSGSPKWNVVQQASDLDDYQRKLDFFAIEIGAVHKSSDQIWRIASLSTEKVVTESSRSAESNPRYFVNQRKRLLQWDHQTIAQAGIDLQNVLAVHFYPDQLIVKMQQLIDAQYKDQASDIKEVTFKIVGDPGDFRFEIEDVKFNN